jgi:hypothetical protein
MGAHRKPRNVDVAIGPNDAVGCDQLPFGAHGKEGVDGSSPSEGSAKAPQIAAFSIEAACKSSNMRMVMEPFMELPGREALLNAATIRATKRVIHDPSLSEWWSVSNTPVGDSDR